MNKIIISILMAFFGLSFVGCTVHKTQYYMMPGLDHGLLQSPINILSKETETGRYNITVNFKDEINRVENLGHTVQLDIKEGNTITIDNKVFDFKQIHFHTPSEHLIDGITYPMEMHVVNTLQGDKVGYVVFAFHFKMGKENKFINEFLNLIPKDANQSKEIETGIVKLRDLFIEDPEAWKDFYVYHGSLTTPPYTESVHWFVVKKIFEASPEQIKRINRIEGDNARHIQAEYNRTISRF